MVPDLFLQFVCGNVLLHNIWLKTTEETTGYLIWNSLTKKVDSGGQIVNKFDSFFTAPPEMLHQMLLVIARVRECLKMWTFTARPKVLCVFSFEMFHQNFGCLISLIWFRAMLIDADIFTKFRFIDPFW
jgi:hypothetical protein